MRIVLEKKLRKLLIILKRNKRALAELEIAHTRVVYGMIEYGRREAELLMNISSNILSILKDIEEKVFGNEE